MREEGILGREEDVASSPPTLAFWLFRRGPSPGGSQASDWISRDGRFRDMVGDIGATTPCKGWIGTEKAGQEQCGMGKAQQR